MVAKVDDVVSSRRHAVRSWIGLPSRRVASSLRQQPNEMLVLMRHSPRPVRWHSTGGRPVISSDRARSIMDKIRHSMQPVLVSPRLPSVTPPGPGAAAAAAGTLPSHPPSRPTSATTTSTSSKGSLAPPQASATGATRSKLAQMQSDIKVAERAALVKLTPDAQRELDAKLAELQPIIAQQTKSVQVYPITLTTGGIVSRFADLNVSTGDTTVPSAHTQAASSSSSSSSETIFSALDLDDPWQTESPATLEAALAWSDADVAALTAPSTGWTELSDEEAALDFDPLDFVEDREERRLAQSLADEIIRLATPTTLARVAPPDTVRDPHTCGNIPQGPTRWLTLMHSCL
jgi:hypothetical protein